MVDNDYLRDRENNLGEQQQQELTEKSENQPKNLTNYSNQELLAILDQQQRKNQELASALLASQEQLAQLQGEFERQLEAQLNQKAFELEFYYDLSRQVGSTLNYEDLFRSMLKHLHQVVPCDVSGGILVEGYLCELFLNANRPLSHSAQNVIEQQLLDTIIKVNGSILLNQKPLCFHDLNPHLEQSNQIPIKQIGSHFFVPIIADSEAEKKIVGLLFVGTEKPKQFTEKHIRSLYAIANQASTYVQQLRMLLEAEQRRLETEKIRQALAREKELNELKTRIVRTISHEYRTPLTIISLATDLLESQDGKLSQDQKATCFRQIRTATGHMANLLEDVFLVHQTESEEIEFLPTPVDIVGLCHQLINHFQSIASPEQEILFNYQGNHNTVTLDKKIVRQVLNNLLSNAIKYSPDGGVINLEVRVHQEQIIFTIRDRGIGIPPADRSSIFECFHRAGNVGTIPGTGLGLAIVKKYVDIHQGEISFESELNRGTTFTIKLPIYQ